MGNRKKAEDVILTYIEKLMPGSDNPALYKSLFASMNDVEFEQFILDLESGKKNLAIIAPNFGKQRLETGRNFEIARELGHEFFQRIWMPAKAGMPQYLTPIKYLVIDLPLRRQAQLLDKKLSVADDNNSIDNMTGQPTGKSKGSKISYPEVQVLAALNQEKALTEFLKYRGGDEKGYTAMNTMISRTGRVSMNAIKPYSGTVKSTQVLSTLLSGMHLKNNL